MFCRFTFFKNNHKYFLRSCITWLSLILCFYRQAAFSQPVFQSYYDESTNTSFGKSIHQLSSGDFVITGFTGTGAPYYNGIHLVKISPSGNFLWGKIYGSSGYETGECLAPTNDGGFIIAGFGDANPSGTDQDIYIIKTNASGNILWQKQISYNINYDYAHSIIQAGDGGYVTCGYATTTSDYSPPVINIIKLSANGSATGAGTWNVLYGSGNGAEAFDIIETTDGNFVLTGSYFTGNGNSDIFLLKVNSSDGSAIWSRTYGGSTSDNGYSVKQTKDGGFIITGRTLSYGSGDFDCFLLKTDPTGNAQWFKTYGNLYWDEGHSVIQTSDDGYVVGGLFHHDWSDRDFYIFKTDDSGNLLWHKAYGGNNWEECEGMILCNDGGYALTGRTFSFMSGFGYNAYVVKTDAFGNANCNFKPEVTIVNSYLLAPPGTMTMLSGTLSAATATFSETPFFNSGILCSNMPLPIELISFKGKAADDKNILSWTTASETGNDYFTILKGSTKENFESIGKIKGAGNSTQTLNYTFTDAKSFAGINYYQLRQTDYNGQASFSEIIAVNNSSDKINPLIISPNPATDEIIISGFEFNTNDEIQIVNTLGELVYQNKINEAASNFKLQIANFAQGIYFIKVKHSPFGVQGAFYSQKFIKQ